VLKEVANTNAFTTLDFCGTHEGNLEMDDTNEDCIMFDVGQAINEAKLNIFQGNSGMLSLLTLHPTVLLAWHAM
jgi:hypothetical protein